MGIWPFGRKMTPAPVRAVSVQDVHEMQQAAEAERRKSRQQRRREEREARKASEQARVCWRCGYAAIKGVSGSNLIRGEDMDGNGAWTHNNPAVCAGAVRAVTQMARETVSESWSDAFRITYIRLGGYLRLWFHSLKTGLRTFFNEEQGMNLVGGRASVENTREDKVSTRV